MTRGASRSSVPSLGVSSLGFLAGLLKRRQEVTRGTSRSSVFGLGVLSFGVVSCSRFGQEWPLDGCFAAVWPQSGGWPQSGMTTDTVQYDHRHAHKHT